MNSLIKSKPTSNKLLLLFFITLSLFTISAFTPASAISSTNAGTDASLQLPELVEKYSHVYNPRRKAAFKKKYFAAGKTYRATEKCPLFKLQRKGRLGFQCKKIIIVLDKKINSKLHRKIRKMAPKDILTGKFKLTGNSQGVYFKVKFLSVSIPEKQVLKLDKRISIKKSKLLSKKKLMNIIRHKKVRNYRSFKTSKECPLQKREKKLYFLCAPKVRVQFRNATSLSILKKFKFVVDEKTFSANFAFVPHSYREASIKSKNNHTSISIKLLKIPGEKIGRENQLFAYKYRKHPKPYRTASFKKWSPLWKAIWASKNKDVKTLLEQGANASWGKSSHALGRAIPMWNSKAVEYLIEAGADVNDSNAREPFLHKAAFNGNPKVIEVLVLKGANIHALDNSNRSVLHAPVLYNKYNNTIALIQLGARVNQGNDSSNLLITAAKNGNLDLVKVLITYRAKINNANPKKGYTPLHAAAYEGHLEIVKYLAEKGAYLNPVASIKTGQLYDYTHTKYTPLQRVDAKKYPDIVSYLKSKGAR